MTSVLFHALAYEFGFFATVSIEHNLCTCCPCIRSKSVYVSSVSGIRPTPQMNCKLHKYLIRVTLVFLLYMDSNSLALKHIKMTDILNGPDKSQDLGVPSQLNEPLIIRIRSNILVSESFRLGDFHLFLSTLQNKLRIPKTYGPVFIRI